MPEGETVSTWWDWVAVSIGGSGAGAVVRALAYRMRERGRSQAITSVMREMPIGGGRVEARDRGEVSWVVDVRDNGEDG
ncbi:hypothetical protein GCM10009665_01590 [Kitasatospora nipponensis]|uniref:Uncharacterized protein n=1 Tax=Kitasatospora nipponensis TaxID=258049 RepID=A0ABP4G740_9ACTN